MAYAFNDDKSKVEVYSTDEVYNKDELDGAIKAFYYELGHRIGVGASSPYDYVTQLPVQQGYGNLMVTDVTPKIYGSGSITKVFEQGVIYNPSNNTLRIVGTNNGGAIVGLGYCCRVIALKTSIFGNTI